MGQYLEIASRWLSYFWETEVLYRQLSESIDQRAFTAAKAKCREMDTKRPGKKYLRSSLYLRANIRRALLLGLDGSEKLKVLDVGCGAGYFLFVCRHLGHEVCGLDRKGNPIYNELISTFGLHRIEHRIQAFEPLPPLGEFFDLITAFAVKFNQRKGRKHWGASEWEFWLKDVHSRLSENGKLFLNLNLAGRNLAHTNPAIFELFSNLSGFRAQFTSGETSFSIAFKNPPNETGPS